MQCPPKAVHCLCYFPSKWNVGLGSRAPWLFKSPQKWSLLISLQGEDRWVSWESAVPPEAQLGSWEKSMCSGHKLFSRNVSFWRKRGWMSRDNSFPPPCATESGTPGSQNSSSTCTGGYRHNQVPVLFWKDCSCRFYLKRRSFEREFFLFHCHKRFTPFRNDAPSNPFPFILLWLLVLWEERLDTDTRHTSLPVLLTQVTASSLFKWSGTKETAAQRVKGEGHGLVKLPSLGAAAWGSPPPFSASQRYAHPPKVFQKKTTEYVSLWNVERPGSVIPPPLAPGHWGACLLPGGSLPKLGNDSFPGFGDPARRHAHSCSPGSPTIGVLGRLDCFV